MQSGDLADLGRTHSHFLLPTLRLRLSIMSLLNVKTFLPQSLFGRAALIYFVPVLTILGVMSVVFIQRLYEDVTRQMTEGVADELALIVATMNEQSSAEEALERGQSIARPLRITVLFSETPMQSSRAWIDLSGITVQSTLRESFPDIGAIDLTTRDGAALSSFGVMGGHMQPQGHVQMMLRMFQQGLNPQAALDAPRWYLSPEFDVAMESGFADGVVDELRSRGHHVLKKPGMELFGGGQAIPRQPGGEDPMYVAGSDWRKDGQAVGF
ncbi:MAG: gamma-glutamyltransferase [Pseudomonadota bacterium]